MPRPAKCKRVCALPAFARFGPEGENAGEPVEMTVEEYETIRLIDLEGLTQLQCSEQMSVARTTVQAIYNEARRKLADCLVHGKPLKIEGGTYQICQSRKDCCGRHCQEQHPAHPNSCMRSPCDMISDTCQKHACRQERKHDRDKNILK